MAMGIAASGEVNIESIYLALSYIAPQQRQTNRNTPNTHATGWFPDRAGRENLP
jgi:hypothetical protein